MDRMSRDSYFATLKIDPVIYFFQIISLFEAGMLLARKQELTTG